MPFAVVNTPHGTHYTVHDLCVSGCVAGAYVYQETNGLPGLQRADAIRDDTCHGLVPADTLVAGAPH